MSSWKLTDGLQNLRRQVNAAFPNRSTVSDGTIGDAAHQGHTSGHNPDDTPGSKPEWDGDPDSTPEVRAWDMTADLGDGVSTQTFVDHVRKLPNLGSVIRYMIYNHKMYHVDDGFRPTAYTGSSPHTEHVHFSGARSQAADNNTTFDYRLDEIPVSLTTADRNWLSAEIRDAVRDAVQAIITPTALTGPDGQPDGTQSTLVGHHVLSQGIPSPGAGGKRVPAYVLLADILSAVASPQS